MISRSQARRWKGKQASATGLAKGFDLPPLIFTFDEVEALVAGARMMEAWGGPALQDASRSALAKLALALPPERREELERSRVFVPDFHLDPDLGPLLETLRQAILTRVRLRFDYRDKAERSSDRTVRPLGLHFWGSVWTLAAWCETRAGFRNFRLDRISAVETGQAFEEEPGKTLDDFMHAVRVAKD